MGFFNKLFKRNVEGIVAPNQYYNPTTDDYEVVQGSNGAAQVSLASSNVIQPVDVQARYATTIQTHNAVSVNGSNGTSDSPYYEVNGFDKVAFTLNNATGTGVSGTLIWSNDGNAQHHFETVSGVSYIGTCVDAKAKYVKLRVTNTEAINARIMSAWLYLKA
jgi:hypothetical protein